MHSTVSKRKDYSQVAVRLRVPLGLARAIWAKPNLLLPVQPWHPRALLNALPPAAPNVAIFLLSHIPAALILPAQLLRTVHPVSLLLLLVVVCLMSPLLTVIVVTLEVLVNIPVAACAVTLQGLLLLLGISWGRWGIPEAMGWVPGRLLPVALLVMGLRPVALFLLGLLPMALPLLPCFHTVPCDLQKAQQEVMGIMAYRQWVLWL